MKRFLMAMGLSILLSVSALAGDVPSVGVPAPPPNGITRTTPPSPGDIPISGVVKELKSDALSALLSALRFLV